LRPLSTGRILQRVVSGSAAATFATIAALATDDESSAAPSSITVIPIAGSLTPSLPRDDRVKIQ
jgi:hypothetical protein